MIYIKVNKGEGFFMNFSNKQLQDLIQGKIVGDSFPYCTKNEVEIEAHIRRLFHRINRISNIVCEAEWNHFGSGYASFIEFFCYQKEDVTVVKEINNIQKLQTEGIIIDICRLAPVAIMGEDTRYKTMRTDTNEIIGGGYGCLFGGPHLLNISEKYETIVRKLEYALKEFEYERLETEKIHQPLSFQAKIPTIYSNSNDYVIMDAIFYWED